LFGGRHKQLDLVDEANKKKAKPIAEKP